MFASVQGKSGTKGVVESVTCAHSWPKSPGMLQVALAHVHYLLLQDTGAHWFHLFAPAADEGILAAVLGPAVIPIVLAESSLIPQVLEA